LAADPTTRGAVAKELRLRRYISRRMGVCSKTEAQRSLPTCERLGVGASLPLGRLLCGESRTHRSSFGNVAYVTASVADSGRGLRCYKHSAPLEPEGNGAAGATNIRLRWSRSVAMRRERARGEKYVGLGGAGEAEVTARRAAEPQESIAQFFHTFYATGTRQLGEVCGFGRGR